MGESVLRPCPFCGAVPEYPSGDGTQYEIKCRCGHAGSSVRICDLMTLEERQVDDFTDHRYGEQFILRAKEQAAKNWNTRYKRPKTPGVDGVNYGFGNAKDLLEKVKRDRVSLKRAINEQDEILIKDSIFNFSVAAYSIKDWLKNGHFSADKDKNEVERYINKTPMLRLCADLCNGSKHKLLTSRKETADPVESVKDSELDWSDTTLPWSNTGLPWSGCYTVRIELDSGVAVEIQEFADQVIDSWDSFFKAKGL